VLARFAADLIHALRADGQPVPLHLEDHARKIIRSRWWVMEPRDQGPLDALCRLIEGWPAFARWFAHFAAPRIHVFAATRHRTHHRAWDDYINCPSALAGSLTEPGQLHIFRDCFHSLWY
jgi:hypothetical protein